MRGHLALAQIIIIAVISGRGLLFSRGLSGRVPGGGGADSTCRPAPRDVGPIGAADPLPVPGCPPCPGPEPQPGDEAARRNGRWGGSVGLQRHKKHGGVAVLLGSQLVLYDELAH